jgi:hypothetical protein
MFSDPPAFDVVRDTLGGLAITSLGVIIGGMALREAYFYFGLHERQLLRGRWQYWLENLSIVAAIVACVYLRGPGGKFIYFQF